jgi:hypothetical protein
MVIGFVLCACDSLVGGSKGGITMSKSEMNEELIKLKEENQELQEQIDIEKVVNQQIKIESNKMIKHLSDRNRTLTREIHQLKGKIHRITQKNYTLTEKFESVEAKDETPSSKFKSRQPKKRTSSPKYASRQAKAETSSSKSDKAQKDIKGLNIKVLNGDGKPKSAAKMAKRLRGSGYKVNLIGDAPKSTFRVNTIFFAAHAEDDAKRLESRLDVPLILKPLSWSSKFDLIVVTGSKK